MLKERPRNNFDAVRLTAALTVIVSHAYPLSGRVEPTVFGGVTLGTCAVYVFFAISGFLTTRSWRLDPSPVRFLCKRMLRIGPAYVAALGVVGLGLSFARIHLFADNPMPFVNGSLWTIPFEVQCYLLLLVAAMMTRHAGLILGSAVVATAGHGNLMTFLAFFAVGSIFSEYKELQRPTVYVAVLALGAAAFAADWRETGIVLILTPAALWIGTASWLGVRDVGRGGDISYGVYLYAFPIQQTIVVLLGAHQPILVHIALTAGFSAAAGIVSWRVIEQPALALKPRIATGPRPALHEPPTEASAEMEQESA